MLIAPGMVQSVFENVRRALRQKFHGLRNFISAKEFREQIESIPHEWAGYSSDGP